MYKWNIDIVLKSGHILNCEYVGPENKSDDVVRNLFHGKAPTDWIGLAANNHTHQIFVASGEMAAIDIYEGKGDI